MTPCITLPNPQAIQSRLPSLHLPPNQHQPTRVTTSSQKDASTNSTQCIITPTPNLPPPPPPVIPPPRHSIASTNTTRLTTTPQNHRRTSPLEYPRTRKRAHPCRHYHNKTVSQNPRWSLYPLEVTIMA
eukprot:PhF_6_TR38725/c0_g1_i2/m.57964